MTQSTLLITSLAALLADGLSSSVLRGLTHMWQSREELTSGSYMLLLHSACLNLVLTKAYPNHTFFLAGLPRETDIKVAGLMKMCQRGSIFWRISW